MVYFEPPPPHHFFLVAGSQRIIQVAPNIKQNGISFKTPLNQQPFSKVPLHPDTTDPSESPQAVCSSNSKQVRTMQYLVTLHLKSPNNSLQYVKKLPGFIKVEIDENYGLVPISPKRDLYVIRVSGDLDPAELMSIQPEVKGVHGDVRVAPTGSD